jgi:hypothetical protein
VVHQASGGPSILQPPRAQAFAPDVRFVTYVGRGGFLQSYIAFSHKTPESTMNWSVAGLLIGLVLGFYLFPRTARKRSRPDTRVQ